MGGQLDKQGSNRFQKIQKKNDPTGPRWFWNHQKNFFQGNRQFIKSTIQIDISLSFCSFQIKISGIFLCSLFLSRIQLAQAVIFKKGLCLVGQNKGEKTSNGTRCFEASESSVITCSKVIPRIFSNLNCFYTKFQYGLENRSGKMVSTMSYGTCYDIRADRHLFNDRIDYGKSINSASSVPQHNGSLHPQQSPNLTSPSDSAQLTRSGLLIFSRFF